MIEKLNEIEKKSLEQIDNINNLSEVEEIRKKIFGKQSELSEIMKEIGSLSPEMKKEVGKRTTEIKSVISKKLEEKEQYLVSQKSVLDRKIDLTVPGNKKEIGTIHPIIQMRNDLNEAFMSLGFEVYKEDEISSEKYAFDNLNFAPDHPARECMDTYWIDGTENKLANERICLRPHLTGGSVRYLLKNGAPARFVYPGAVFRNESVDARHERCFYQYEALIVDKNISFSSGIVMIQTILEKVFGRKINIRMREGFFPFVEPGYEIDMECVVCGGKGCRTCNHNGWIEVMPGGVIHPNVLKSANLDPNEWTGFYINIGLDRLVMMRYGIDDIRLIRSSDLRFLKQFK